MDERTKQQIIGAISAMKVLAKDDHKIAALALWRAVTGDDLKTALRVFQLVTDEDFYSRR